MNNPDRDSSIIKFNGSTLSLILWATVFASYFKLGGFVPIVLALLVLFLEKDSDFLRQTAGQVLVLSIVNFIITTILSIVITIFVIILGPLNLPLFAIVKVLFFFVAAVFILISILGMLKAYQKKVYILPIVGSFGEKIEASIKPSA